MSARRQKSSRLDENDLLKIEGLLVVILLVGVVVACFFLVKTNGWEETAEGEKYRVDDEYQTGRVEIDEKTYFFDDNGIKMHDTWIMVDGLYAYLQSDGTMATGDQTIDGVNYHFEENGTLKNGWVDGALYKNGYLATGFTDIEGVYYYLSEEGKAISGWQTIDGNRYYFNQDGSASTGFQTIENKPYYFYNDGKMATSGWTTIDGKQYHFDDDGIMAVDTTIDDYYIDNTGAAVNLYDEITENNLEPYLHYLLTIYGDDLRSIYDYVHDGFEFRATDKEDIISMTCRMLNTGSGSCWDYAALTYELLTAAGYNAQIVIGVGAIADEHNWVIVEVEPGVWRHMDTQHTMETFLVTDDWLEGRNGQSEYVHYEWDRDAYPVAE